MIDAAKGFQRGGDRIAQAEAGMKLAVMEGGVILQRVPGGLETVRRRIGDKHMMALMLEPAGDGFAGLAAESKNECDRMPHRSDPPAG